MTKILMIVIFSFGLYAALVDFGEGYGLSFPKDQNRSVASQKDKKVEEKDYAISTDEIMPMGLDQSWGDDQEGSQREIANQHKDARSNDGEVQYWEWKEE